MKYKRVIDVVENRLKYLKELAGHSPQAFGIQARIAECKLILDLIILDALEDE